MEQCVAVKRCVAMVNYCPSSRIFRPSLMSLPSSSSSLALSTSSSRVRAMVGSDDFGLLWQPVFSFKQADLMADAPYLLKACEDFDWKAQVNELRERASLSLLNTVINKSQAPKSQDVNQSTINNHGDPSNNNGDTWFAAVLALATALVQCSFHLTALAAEEAIEKSEAAEAASRAPAWLIPSLLAFPVISYVLFSVYRDQVNPYAKISDWMFGVAALVIIANLVLISTIGVRLY